MAMRSIGKHPIMVEVYHDNELNSRTYKDRTIYVNASHGKYYVDHVGSRREVTRLSSNPDKFYWRIDVKEKTNAD